MSRAPGPAEIPRIAALRPPIGAAHQHAEMTLFLCKLPQRRLDHTFAWMTSTGYAPVRWKLDIGDAFPSLSLAARIASSRFRRNVEIDVPFALSTRERYLMRRSAQPVTVAGDEDRVFLSSAPARIEVDVPEDLCRLICPPEPALRPRSRSHRHLLTPSSTSPMWR